MPDMFATGLFLVSTLASTLSLALGLAITLIRTTQRTRQVRPSSLERTERFETMRQAYRQSSWGGPQRNGFQRTEPVSADDDAPFGPWSSEGARSP